MASCLKGIKKSTRVGQMTILMLNEKKKNSEDDGINGLSEPSSGILYRNVMDVKDLLNYRSENNVAMESPIDKNIIKEVFNTLYTSQS